MSALELERLEFEPLADGQCCKLCNPYALVDYETTCVAVRHAGGNRLYFCVPCITSLCGAARRVTIVSTNGADLARWKKLEARGRQ